MAYNLTKQMSLKELAEEASMSKYHLCRGFKKTVGMSPMQFLTAMRVERAKKLLEESSLNVTLIALEVGFNDLSNFIEHFKKIVGSTPTAYKKSIPKGTL
jgi:AraC-like DNA-binding protein